MRRSSLAKFSLIPACNHNNPIFRKEKCCLVKKFAIKLLHAALGVFLRNHGRIRDNAANASFLKLKVEVLQLSPAERDKLVDSGNLCILLSAAQMRHRSADVEYTELSALIPPVSGRKNFFCGDLGKWLQPEER